MATSDDFNAVLDDIFLGEEREHKQSYTEGFKAGADAGNPEGYHLGYHRGAELGRELGYYLGIITHHINLNEEAETKYPEKIFNQLTKVKDLINTFPRDNPEDIDILGLAEAIRAQYKKACALLKIPSDGSNPQMASKITLLRNHISSITKYLTPLLPLANCHMVEFITESHWDRILPEPLREYLESRGLDQALEEFWKCHDNQQDGTTELSKWIAKARSHHVTVNNEYCISTTRLKELITSWGGTIRHELKVTEFMTPKKSYEVLRMSQLVGGLFGATTASCAVEAGGGRGPLPVALTLGYGVPTLSVDCNARARPAAEKRVNMIKKQWHVIAKRSDGATEARISTNDRSLHQFATAYITEQTDLASLVREKFPHHDDTRLLLTGLHTCGDLGPVSLRLFRRHVSIAALFNVPCCYHLLSEGDDPGFPMARCLKGFALGRNARMLANHSIERVASQKELPAKSLLYRAMLEVLIQTHIPEAKNLATGKLKRISSKADCFEQYFKMADNILKLNIFDSFPAEKLSELSDNEEYYWKKLVLFYMVKLCLAQVVESLILLDRVMYLCENDFEKVYLVKLFDPVLSPRCHGIVAVR